MSGAISVWLLQEGSMNLLIPSLGTASPGERTVRKPSRKSAVWESLGNCLGLSSVIQSATGKQGSLLPGVSREISLSLFCFPFHGQTSHPVLLCSSTVLHLHFYIFCLIFFLFLPFCFIPALCTCCWAVTLLPQCESPSLKHPDEGF